MNKKLPRGITNCNPGNIERGKDRWLGMSADQSTDPRFLVFDKPESGIRALMRLLINYQERHDIKTLRAAITALVGGGPAGARPAPSWKADELAHRAIGDVAVVTEEALERRDRTEQLDRVLLHPVFGPVVFLGLMVGLFAAVYAAALKGGDRATADRTAEAHHQARLRAMEQLRHADRLRITRSSPHWT